MRPGPRSDEEKLGDRLTFGQLSALIYLMQSYPPQLTASATAALGVLRYIFGAIFPLFALRLYDALGFRNSVLLLAGTSGILMPVPWILLKYGPALRARSRFNVARR